MDLFSYSFQDLSFREVIAVSHDHLSKVVLVDIEPFEGDRLHSIGMEMRALPDLSAARLWCSPGRATRTAAHVADGNDNLILVMPTESDMVISRPGHEEMICRAGQAYVWTGDEQASLAYHSHCETLSLSLPRTVLSSRTGGTCSRLMSVLDPSSAADLWLLRGYAALLAGDSTLTRDAGFLAAAHLQELAALLLGRDRDRAELAGRPGVRAARLTAIKTDVAADVAQPISVEAVSARHGISPRYLRALFADEGTSFTDFVLGQRLARARRMLCDPRLAGHTVAAIAYEVGFNDLSYFNRTFRRRYAMTPSDARAT